MKSFKGTDSRVLGQKFEGSLESSLLWMRIVAAFFHSLGTIPEIQTFRMVSVRFDVRYKHYFKHIIEIWS